MFPIRLGAGVAGGTKAFCAILSGCGAVLVARLNGVQEAAGSTPVTRTTQKRYPLGYLFFAFTAFFAENHRNLRPLVYCIFGRRPQARECVATAGSTPVTRTMASVLIAFEKL